MGKTMVIVVAAMMVAVAGIGAFLYFSSGEDPEIKTGVLLSYDEYDCEWVTMKTEGLTVKEAFDKAQESIKTDFLGAGEDWSFLWTMSASATEWNKTLGDWEEMNMEDFKFVAFSKKDIEPVVVKDADGDLMFNTIGSKKRIVSLSPSITDVVTAAGARSKIIGADDNSQLELGSGVTGVGGYYSGPSFEKIVALKPDLVIADKEVPNQVPLIARLKGAGITVLTVAGGNTLDNICANVMTVGYVTGNIQYAKDKVDNIKSVAEELREMGEELSPSPSVLILMPYKYGGTFSYYVGGGLGNASFVNDILTAAGGTNVFASTTGWQQLSLENIYNSQPDIIIVMLGMDYVSNAAEEALSDPILAEMEAVKNGKVYSFGGDASSKLSRPGPDLIHAMAMLYLVFSMDDDEWEDNTWGEYGSDYMNILKERLPGLFQ